MDPEAVRRTLEPTASPTDITGSTPYDSFVVSGLRFDAAEHGRVLCSFVVAPRLASPQGYLLSGVTATLADQLGSAVFYCSGVGFSGVSLEISLSYVDTATIGSPQGYLLSGVTATLADQLGSAVFYSSGVGLIAVSSRVGLSGVSLEINVSYVDTATVGEEIEVEAKLLRAGKSVGVVSVDFRKKRTGKLMAQARHTKYLALSSKL